MAREKTYCYEYPRPAVTVDVVAFSLVDRSLQTLLIRRRHDPFAGRWALPGGFLDLEEEVDVGARRELREETGLEPAGPLEPLGFFGAPGRDPRGRTISLAYVSVFRSPPPEPTGADDATEAAWIDLRALGPLAFDHDLILAKARTWLQRAVMAGPVGLALLPEVFTQAEVELLLLETTGQGASAARWRGTQEKAGTVVRLGGRPSRYRIHNAAPA